MRRVSALYLAALRMRCTQPGRWEKFRKRQQAQIERWGASLDAARKSSGPWKYADVRGGDLIAEPANANRQALVDHLKLVAERFARPVRSLRLCLILCRTKIGRTTLSRAHDIEFTFAERAPNQPFPLAFGRRAADRGICDRGNHDCQRLVDDEISIFESGTLPRGLS